MKKVLYLVLSWSRAGEEARRAEQNVISFVLGVFVFFFCLVGLGGRRSGSPAMIDHFDLGRGMAKGEKMVAAVHKGSGNPLPWPFGPHVAG